MGLEACGARVVEASNAATARQFVQTQPLNLVVTDLAMPREDGVSLLKWLRARLPDHNGTPAVIAVTAFYVPGYAAYFQKPIKIEDFVATVASVLGRGRGGGASESSRHGASHADHQVASALEDVEPLRKTARHRALFRRRPPPIVDDECVAVVETIASSQQPVQAVGVSADDDDAPEMRQDLDRGVDRRR